MGPEYDGQIGHRYFATGRYPADLIWKINCDVLLIEYDQTPLFEGLLRTNRFEERIRLTLLSSNIDSRVEPVPFRNETFVDEDPLAWEIKRNGILVDLDVRKQLQSNLTMFCWNDCCALNSHTQNCPILNPSSLTQANRLPRHNDNCLPWSDHTWGRSRGEQRRK